MTQDTATRRPDPGTYCRDVESYLCRKNDGHLIRIVGPAFEVVCQWAASQIPLRVIYRAIDRTFGRYYAKEGRRRPVRIEYCEADVLDLFDQWRRAVGMAAGEREVQPSRSSRRASLGSHIDRVVDRLTEWQQTSADAERRTNAVAEFVAELVTLRERAIRCAGRRGGGWWSGSMRFSIN